MTKINNFVILFSLTFVVLIFTQKSSYAQLQTGSFEFGGHTREYAVFIPQNYQPNMPVVINLHGGGGSIQDQMELTLMNEFADTSGFIVVYPQAIGFIAWWNVGCPNCDKEVDDVGFISALIDTVDANYNIDMSRIYCTGMSMGAGMTFRLAGELTHRFAAVAPIAGNLFDLALTWNLVRPIPVLHMHGTADSVVFYNGGANYWSVEESLNFLIQNSNCSSPPDTFLFPDIDTLDNSTVEKLSWTNCSENSSVIHYKIINGGHTWPGGTPIPEAGNTNMDISANAEIWNFFQNYENPLVSMAWAKNVYVNPRYLDPQGDTLFIKAHITNPENHPISVYVKINGEVVTFSDSLQLYDDGMHFDENANDNIWGNAKWLTVLEEDKFSVETYTHDFSLGTIYKRHVPTNFTTAGPIVFNSYYLVGDTVPGAGDYTAVKLSLENIGNTATVPKVTAYLYSLDTSLAKVTVTNNPDFGYMSPGQIAHIRGGFYGVEISPNAPHGVPIPFGLDIASEGNVYWKDTTSMFIVTSTNIVSNEIPTEFSLEQNYPNPFNPSTKISWKSPAGSHQILKIYDLLGNEVATIVEEYRPAGSYEVEFDAEGLTSGIYFYKLQVGSKVETKKMILLR